MNRRGMLLIALSLGMPVISLAQASNTSRSEIIIRLLAEEATARIDLPFGGEGVQITDHGQIDEPKLNKQIQKNGRSIPAGRIVRVTNVEFGTKSIDVELDHGGKEKKKFSDHIQVSAGGASTPAPQTSNTPKAIGSKVTLVFSSKVPSELTYLQVQQLLTPVLDFTKKTIVSTNIDSLPPEFKAAILAKEAAIGMDQDMVLLSMGIPDRKRLEKVEGVEQEDWEYGAVGMRRTFVTFEKNVVVKVTAHQ